MSIYVVYPSVEGAKRSDSKNLFVIGGAASAAAARNQAEAMAGANLNSFLSTDWNAVALSDVAAESFVAPRATEPFGKRNGSWSGKLYNGDPMAN